MKKTLFLACTVFSLLAFNCSKDDEVNNQPTNQNDFDEVIAAITNNGDSKTWKIESASLTNNNVSNLSVTSAFNILEDEFLFQASGTTIRLEHKQRNDFNRSASNSQEFLLDAYKSSLNYTLSASADDTNLFSDASGILNLTYVNDNLITGEWILGADSKLSFDLSVKTAADYRDTPTSLSFEEIASIPQEFAFYESYGSADVIASQANNGLYLTYRTFAFENPDGGNNSAEGLIKFDFDSGSFEHNAFHQSDFITRRASLNSEGLNIVGSQYFNNYNNLSALLDPDITSNYNDLQTNFISYYDAVSYNEDTYIIGGNTVEAGEPNPIDAILKYNATTEAVVPVATLPSPKANAASEFIDNKIYIFSGAYSFFGEAETSSYIYNIDSNTFQSFDVPTALNVSFTTSVEHIIYVAGQIKTLDPTTSITNTDAYLGAYNTETNEFTEITHNLNDSDDYSRISGIATANDKIYIVYQNTNTSEFINETYVIMAADL